MFFARQACDVTGAPGLISAVGSGMRKNIDILLISLINLRKRFGFQGEDMISTRRVGKLALSLCPVIFLILFFTGLARADYRQVAGLIDLRSTFSDGAYDVNTLAGMARERGFEVIVINDHDVMAMEYGLPPLRNVLKVSKERNSIRASGAQQYLQAITDAEKNNPGVIIIPGSESSPFYYWTGDVFGGLTAHNHERRLLTVGMENPQDYEGLPVLHNGYSRRYLSMALTELVLFGAAFVIGMVLIAWRGFHRITGVTIAVLSLVFAWNSNPFRSSPYDPYHGDQGIAPYQEFIDDVNSRGGMTFWNYPETRSGVRDLGPIKVRTEPYPWVLLDSKGYTGFAALYGDTITITEPGSLWDKVLAEYVRGYRERPAWGIATADYHKEEAAGEKLGNFQTIFLLREKSKKAVLQAMQDGKMYAYRGAYPRSVRLEEFSVSDPAGEKKGFSGDDIVVRGRPRVRIELSVSEPTDQPVRVRLIRSGQVIETFDGRLPLKVDHEDHSAPIGEKHYYRVDMQGCGILVSNPIFVTCETSEEPPPLLRKKVRKARHENPRAEADGRTL